MARSRMSSQQKDIETARRVEYLKAAMESLHGPDDRACGHGRDPEVKRNYVRAMLGLVKRYEGELHKVTEDRSR